MGFTLDTAKLSRSLMHMENMALSRMGSYAQIEAKRLEAEAKANKPWQLRSGHAEQGLTGTGVRSGSAFTITLSGSVHYLVYLELANQKRWAILWPTMQKTSSGSWMGSQRFGGA